MNVLLVDDQIDSVQPLALLLRARGHAVRTLDDPLAALAAMRDFQPDVAIIDIGLPRIDGYELAEHLKLNAAGGCRLLVLSGHPRDARRCAQIGIAGWFAKPVDPDALLAAVERQLRAA